VILLIRCPICKGEIQVQNINKHYKITLGDIINGKFWGKNTLYYHKGCLSNMKIYEKRLLSPITE
jgi:hypothetical protein